MKTKLLTTALFLFLLSVQVFAQSMCALSRNGGNYQQGSIFSVDPLNGSVTVLHSFQSPAGFTPYGNLLQANDGNLYGTCFNGGAFGSCTLFRLVPGTNQYTDVYDFDIVNGDFPTSGLIQGPGSMLYGVATAGGANFGGVLYSYNTFTEAYTVVYSFSNATGSYPYGPPMLHSDGRIYGMTYNGGPYNKGVLYSYDLTTSTYNMLVAFDGTNGGVPFAGLLEASNGLLYGVTSEGGTYQNGVLFSFDPSSNTFTKLVDFSQATGILPKGTLMQGSNGLLYGTAEMGGAFLSSGTIFCYDIPSNTFTKIHDFNGTGDGSGPIGDLYESSGYLYGTAFSGGVNNKGTAYVIDMWNQTFTKLLDFTGSNGGNPTGGFIIVIPTGIATADPVDFGIYPNPAENILTVNLPAITSTECTIRLFDVTGKNVMEKSFTGNLANQIDLELQSLQTGMYVLQLLTDGNSYKQEFVKY